MLDESDMLNILQQHKIIADEMFSVVVRGRVLAAMGEVYDRGRRSLLTDEYRAEAKRITDAMPDGPGTRAAKAQAEKDAEKLKTTAALPRCDHGTPLNEKCGQCDDARRSTGGTVKAPTED